MKSNLIFFYGPPCVAKTFVAKQVAQQTSFTYLNIDEFFASKKVQNENDKLNALIKHLEQKNYVIDGFFDQKAQMNVFFEHYQKPRYIVYFQSSKDEIEQNIRILSTQQEKEIRLKRLQVFLQNRDEVLTFLKKQKFFVTVNAIQKGLSNNFHISSQLIVKEVMKFIQPTVLVAFTYNNPDLADNYLEKLNKELGYVNLHVETLLEDELQLGTPLGKQIGAFLNSGQKVPPQMQIELLKRHFYQDPNVNKFILTSFPEKMTDFIQFEEKLFPIQGLISFFKEGRNISYSANINPVLAQVAQSKHLIITNEDLGPFQSFTTKKTKFGFVTGPSASGKTTLARFIAQKFGYILVEWEPTINALKEKLADVPGEPLDDVPLPKLIKYYTGLFSNFSNDKYVFDGFPPSVDKPELLDQFLQIGLASWFLNIEQTNATYWSRFKQKNELDAAQELTPDDEEKLNGFNNAHNVNLNVFKNYINHQADTKLYGLDTNSSLEQTLRLVEQIYEKRVYLARVVQDLDPQLVEQLRLVYINIAAKNNMTFVDVEQLISKNLDQLENDYNMRWTHQNPSHPSNFNPEKVLKLIKNYLDSLPLQQRDVILWGYSSADFKGQKQDEELLYPRASDELIYIEKLLGTIRILYAIADQPIQTEIQDPEWVLEPPPPPPPKADGDDGAQDPPADGDENKPKYNIFDYQWTKSEQPKNMAQVFLKIKKPQTTNIEVSDHSLKTIYDNFEELQTIVNENSRATFFIQIQLQQPIMD